MPKYRFIKGHCETFNRIDGVEITLLPKPHCQLCADPTSVHQEYDLCYACYTGNTQVDGENLSRVYAASLYIPGVSGHKVSEEIKKLFLTT